MPSRRIFLVNTPQCLMAEGLADLALYAAIGPGWGGWAAEIYADLGLRFDGDRARGGVGGRRRRWPTCGRTPR